MWNEELFYMLGLMGQVIKKLAMSWIMPPLALLLHIVLSMTACSYIIIISHVLRNFCDWAMSD